MTVGAFEKGLVAAVFAVTYDPIARIFYAGLNRYLGDSWLYGMDVDTGEIVSQPTFSDSMLVQSLAHDADHDSGFGVVQVNGGGGNWTTRFAQINLATLNITLLGDDSYDALDAYGQFNGPGVSGPSIHFITAFRPDQSLWLVGVDVTTGDVLLEHPRNASAGLSPNFVDLAFWAGGARAD